MLQPPPPATRARHGGVGPPRQQTGPSQNYRRPSGREPANPTSERVLACPPQNGKQQRPPLQLGRQSAAWPGEGPSMLPRAANHTCCSLCTQHPRRFRSQPRQCRGEHLFEAALLRARRVRWPRCGGRRPSTTRRRPPRRRAKTPKTSLAAGEDAQRHGGTGRPWTRSWSSNTARSPPPTTAKTPQSAAARTAPWPPQTSPRPRPAARPAPRTTESSVGPRRGRARASPGPSAPLPAHTAKNLPKARQ
mmetsp:Transcript_86940/g.278972  ORF Transcript_86940/g.278972 Transcript_86940/m.278972 type:complete len:248 (+) Transcript_86940:1739-2482(+)